MSLSRNDINLDTKAAHLLPGIHNRFSDYFTDFNTDADPSDLDSLAAITVRHMHTVTQDDVDSGRDDAEELGNPVLEFFRITRRDEDGIETQAWHEELTAIHDGIASGDRHRLVTGVERGLVGLGAIDVSVTPLTLREMWFALGATRTRPREVENVYSTGLEPLAVLNRFALRTGMGHIFTDDELVHMRVVLGMCPLGLTHWRTLCPQVHGSEVTWR